MLRVSGYFLAHGTNPVLRPSKKPLEKRKVVRTKRWREQRARSCCSRHLPPLLQPNPLRSRTVIDENLPPVHPDTHWNNQNPQTQSAHQSTGVRARSRHPYPCISSTGTTNTTSVVLTFRVSCPQVSILVFGFPFGSLDLLSVTIPLALPYKPLYLASLLSGGDSMNIKL